jgi:effector-binding domain-containing protein
VFFTFDYPVDELLIAYAYEGKKLPEQLQYRVKKVPKEAAIYAGYLAKGNRTVPKEIVAILDNNKHICMPIYNEIIGKTSY